MTPEQWTRVRELFDKALEASAADRAPLLDQACLNDPEVRREVDSLLAAHDRDPDFIESAAHQLQADLLSDDDDPGLSGRMIGPYLVRHEIGRGGMGVVYLADDTRLGRRIALKAVGSGAGRDPVHRDRLRYEARAAAALSHPGIATAYALEEIDGELYLASEYVPGPTLRALIERGPVQLDELLDIAGQLARALAVAHEHGVVHRDIKPENLVRAASGVVKILDFGIARIESFTGARLTAADAAIGTPAYMAPEQIRGDSVDFRTDIFSFGIVLYELATGRNPFDAKTASASIARILELEPLPVSRMIETGSRALDELVATCLRKNPDERYRSTRALVSDLDRTLEQVRDRVTPGGDSLPAPPLTRRPTNSSRLWWEIHQVVASIVYALMIYPAWRARVWLPAPWTAFFFFGVVAAAVVTVAVRLHLVFAARHHERELSGERARARPLTLVSDILFSVSLLLAGIAISDNHSEVGSLLFSVGVATGISRALIEPSTTRAAFPHQK